MKEIKKQPLRRRGSQHAPPEQRLEQLLKAAIKCFGEKGYHGTTMDDIVKVSGLSKGTLYRFFSSKDDLLMTIVDHWDGWIAERVANFPEAKTPLEQLKQFCDASIAQMNEHRDLINVWLDFFRKDEAKVKIRESHNAYRTMIIGAIDVGVESGHYKSISPKAIANTLIAMLEGVVIVAAADPDFNLEAEFEQMWQVFVASFTINSEAHVK